MTKVETKNNSSDLVQVPLFNPGNQGESPFQAINTTANPHPQKEFSSNAFISEGNSVSNPQSLGIRDLSDEELNGAYESLTPAEQRFHEDQNGDPSVRITRQTKNGPLTFTARLSDVNNELLRRETLESLQGSSGENPQPSKSEIAKQKREQQRRQYWARIFKKRREFGERPPF